MEKFNNPSSLHNFSSKTQAFFNFSITASASKFNWLMVKFALLLVKIKISEYVTDTEGLKVYYTYRIIFQQLINQNS